jgi:hypothetical protein
MSRGHVTSNKRQRDTDKARKKQDKAARRQEKRERGPREIPVVTAADVQRGLPSIEEAMRNIERRGQESRAASTIPARLFVGGLSDEVTEEDLRTAFGAIGQVADAVVMVDRETRSPRGFGFVTMADRKDAPRAISELDGTDLKGRALVVNVATERAR